MGHHPYYQPSAFPAWAECPHWERKEGDKELQAEAEAGTQQHELFAMAMNWWASDRDEEHKKGYCLDIDNENDVARFPKDILLPVRGAVHRTVKLIEDLFQIDGEPCDSLQCFAEEEVEATEDIWEPLNHYITAAEAREPIFGTADLIVEGKDKDGKKHILVVDYKSHYTNKEYWMQLAFYLLAFNCRLDTDATLAVVYGDSEQVDVRHISWLKLRKLLDEVLQVIIDRAIRAKPCKPSAWCSLCQYAGKCETSVALIARTNRLFDQVVPAKDLEAMLIIATEVEKRIKALREYAMQVAKENGGELVNEEGKVVYRVTTAKRSDIDIRAFYEAAKRYFTPDQIIGVSKLTKSAIKYLFDKGLPEGVTVPKKEVERLIEGSSIELAPTERLVRVTK